MGYFRRTSSEGSITNAYNTGNVTGVGDDVGGIVGYNFGLVENTYNTGTITGADYDRGIAGAFDKAKSTLRYSYNTGTINANGEHTDNSAPNFDNWNIDTDGTNTTAAWRRYGNANPILKAFLTRKDNYTGETKTYDGANTGDVNEGYSYGLTTKTSTQAEGIDWASDVYKVTPKDLTVTFGSTTKEYDGTKDAMVGTATLTGLIAGDDVSATATAVYDTKNVGTGKSVSYSGISLTGDKAKNYNLTTTAATGTGAITAKEISATFADISKTYDGTTNAEAGAGTLSGVIVGDTVSVSGTAAFTDKNVGMGKTVNYTGVSLSGTDAGNYTIANTATGKGEIAKANVTFSAENYNRVYNGTTSAEGATLSVASGQIFTGDSYSGGTFAFTDKNAGTDKAITVSDVTIEDGNGGRNYNVTYQNGTGTITPAPLTISTDAVTKEYDGTTSATGAAAKVTSGQLFGTDAISGGTFAFTDKNAGTGKTVTVSDVTIADDNNGGNYNVTYQNNTASEITRKALSLVATPQTITEGEATPTEWSGSVTGFVTGEELGANDTLSFALDNPEAAAVGSYKVTGTLNDAESGDYGTNYTFDNAAANATAFTIAAKYVPPAPTPTPSAPSGGNSGGNTGSTTPTNPTTPTEPTPIAPSGNTDGTTPNSGGNTSGTGANTPTPLAAAERVIVAAVTETETIAAAATAGATAEMSHIADNVRPTNIAEQPTNSGENAAAAPLAAAVETAANAQGFTLTAGGLLAISNETNSAPKDAMSVESIGHALSVLQHGSGEKSAATTPNTETKSAAGSIGSLEEAVEATDLAIGTEIAETDRESGAGQENLASDTGTAGGADESAEESDEKKKR